MWSYEQKTRSESHECEYLLRILSISLYFEYRIGTSYQIINCIGLNTPSNHWQIKNRIIGETICSQTYWYNVHDKHLKTHLTMFVCYCSFMIIFCCIEDGRTFCPWFQLLPKKKGVRVFGFTGLVIFHISISVFLHFKHLVIQFFFLFCSCFFYSNKKIGGKTKFSSQWPKGGEYSLLEVVMISS